MARNLQIEYQNKFTAMKKNIILFALVSLVGLSKAQMVKPTELVSKYASYDGLTISISGFNGSIRGTGPVSVNTTSSGLPTKQNVTINTPASSAPTTKPSTPVSKTPFCKTLKGYSIVDFSATGSENCGCFYLPTNLVSQFKEVQKSGSKMMIKVSVDAQTKINKITGVDAL